MSKTILVDAWKTFFTTEGINQEMHDMLESFPNKKIILTNATPEQVKKLGMENSPYEMYSLNHNPDKIDSTYYKQMLKHFSLETDSVIYFEHSKEAVTSAKSVGITSFWYDEDKKDIEAVRKFIQDNIGN